MKGAEDFLRKFHRDRTDGHAAPLNVGLGANLFGDIERLLKGLVQTAAGMFMLERKLVGLFELTENFRLAQDHRVESAGDLEQVFDTLRFAQGINLVV